MNFEKKSPHMHWCILSGVFFKFKVQLWVLFRTQPSIYDVVFSWKLLTNFTRQLFSRKSSIVDAQLGWVIADGTSPNHRCCQLHNTIKNNLNRLCYKTLNFFAESRYIYFFLDPPSIKNRKETPAQFRIWYITHFMWHNN